MSNHDGGYMLNKVLYVAKEMGIFKSIGEEKAREFTFELIKIGEGNDCNAGEILEEIGEELGICSCCIKETDDIENGLCKECR